jgi:hypothetical protein
MESTTTSAVAKTLINLLYGTGSKISTLSIRPNTLSLLKNSAASKPLLKKMNFIAGFDEKEYENLKYLL